MSSKRKFSSYGTIITACDYFAPRIELIERGKKLLIGNEKRGNYITVWASRQSGKSTTLNEIEYAIKRESKDFHVVSISAECYGPDSNILDVMNSIIKRISNDIKMELHSEVKKKFPTIKKQSEFVDFFTSEYLPKKLILIIDEFDRMEDDIISELTHYFRLIYLDSVKNKANKPLLHSLALIGIRSVLGIENQKGSPFNVQNSLRIPHLTYDEVNLMFHEYMEEHGQIVEQDVIDKLFHETQGQPGLISWFGELLTVTYNETKDKPITMKNWHRVYAWTHGIPNNNTLNLISKVRTNKKAEELVLNLFQTKEKFVFEFENKTMNYLFLNGIIKPEEGVGQDGLPKLFIKFTCQFIHRRLFEYYSHQLVEKGRNLISDPFMDMSNVYGDDFVNVDELIKLFQEYISKNKDKLFKDAPRRKTDLSIYEAVYHFHFFSFLEQFLQTTNNSIHPEFPTGNGKIDLLIKNGNKIKGIELKSFMNMVELEKSKRQAAEYAKSLGISKITLLVFIESDIPADKKIEIETSFFDNDIEVQPRFIQVS